MGDLVSVVIPTVGRASVFRAIGSARRQGVDVEIIVVDDRPEGASEISGSPGLRVVRTCGGVGAAEARNRGMQAAEGRFVAFLDDDDVWLPGHLRSALRTLGNCPAASIYTSRGLVLDEEGNGRLEPAVLIGKRSVAQYFFERSTWRSRCRRVLTPTLVFRAELTDHLMDGRRDVHEDTWWLLTAERDLGARIVQTSHVGAVIHASPGRISARVREGLRDWWDEVDSVYPGAAASEQLSLIGRSAVRQGDPKSLRDVGRDILGRPGGWTWLPVLAGYGGAAAVVAAKRRVSGM